MKSHRPQLFNTLGILLVLSVLLAVFPVVAMAASYPGKPVRLIVPYPPGGTTDLIGRLVASQLSERLGQQVFVDNQGGGGGIVGMEMTAKSAPDGYTLGISPGGFAIQPVLQKLPYDPLKDFTPIARVVDGPMVLFVNESVPVHSVKELIALAKQKPGQLLFVSPGAGGATHMAMELFKDMAGIDFKIVQFKGGGPSMLDVLGGHSHASINSVGQALPHIQSGKFRVLATTGKERSVFLPDMPTIAEAGLPGYEATNWFGVVAPAGIPAPIVDRLNKEIKAFLAVNDVKKRFTDIGAEVGYQDPAEFSQFIKEGLAKWKLIVEKAGIKIE